MQADTALEQLAAEYLLLEQRYARLGEQEDAAEDRAQRARLRVEIDRVKVRQREIIKLVAAAKPADQRGFTAMARIALCGGIEPGAWENEVAIALLRLLAGPMPGHVIQGGRAA